MKRMRKLVAALAAACTLFGGIGAAQAADAPAASSGNPVYGKTSVSNVKVSDVGAHTADVSFDYSIDPALLPQIANVCFSVNVQRITEVTATKAPSNQYAWGWYDVSCSGVEDEDLTQSTYNHIYGVHKETVTDVKGNEVGTASFQSYNRYYKDSWDGKASGRFDMSLIGLQENTTYANQGLSEFGLAPQDVNLWRTVDKVYQQGGHTADAGFGQIYAGLRIELKNGDFVPFGYASAPVPSFTTTDEKASAAASDKLTEQNKGDVTVPGGTVKAGSAARVYINGLQQACAAKVDAGEDCFWYAYIYSDPVRLTGPDGSPYVTVKKDAAGKYYVDAYIPAGYSGDHKIALQDADGAIQGWTAVTVGDKADEPAPNPAPALKADKTALNTAIEAAGKLAQSDYTEATWAPFAKALDAAKAVAAKQDASQSDVDAAAKALTDAQGALVKAEKAPAPVPAPDASNNTGDKDAAAPSDKQSADDTANVDQPAATSKKLAATGVSVLAVAAVAVALMAVGIALKGARRVRR